MFISFVSKWRKPGLAHGLRTFRASCAKFQRSSTDHLVVDLDGHQKAQTTQNIPFSGTRIGNFFQQPHRLENPYLQDSLLQNFLKRTIPEKFLQEICSDLERFGHRIAVEIDDLGRQCELNPPSLQQYDAWGNRVDKIVTCEAWKKMHRISAEEGLISIAYKRQFQQWSRLHQFSKMYLYNPSSGLYSCPLAMTDGAAKIIEQLNLKVQLSSAYERLTTQDPDRFWTSGQWMTERKGGSDVGNGTETVAIEQADGSYKLYGFKWFTSATDANMTITLARVADSNGQVVQGTKGLSLFYLETRDSDGNLNNIEIQKLKNKLGTRQLPTAELLLNGSTAHRISDEGRGVAGIVSMLTISRLHNSLSSVALMRRMIQLARDYSLKRTAFNQQIADIPLHMQTLARMEVETRGCFFLTMELGRLLGLEDTGQASQHQLQLLRLLTPITKLYTAKQAVKLASEGVECFGGQGYMEDTGLPSMLRDAQVLPIWEGTTNILSLDVLRSLAKSGGAVLQAYSADITARLDQVRRQSPAMADSAETVGVAAGSLAEWLESVAAESPHTLQVAARDLAFSLARTYIGMLLLEHAAWDRATQQDRAAATRWCEQDLVPVFSAYHSGQYDQRNVQLDKQLVMD